VGGRYDGYERSLESAEANILEGEGALKRRNRSLGSMAAEAWQQGAVTQKRKDQLKQGLRTVPPPLPRSFPLSSPPGYQLLENQGRTNLTRFLVR